MEDKYDDERIHAIADELGESAILGDFERCKKLLDEVADILDENDGTPVR